MQEISGSLSEVIRAYSDHNLLVPAATDIKYGFVKMEHEYCCCPKCRNILNAGPNYQPEFCDRCGQALDFSNTEWEEDKRIGFLKPEAV